MARLKVKKKAQKKPPVKAGEKHADNTGGFFTRKVALITTKLKTTPDVR